MDLAFACAHGSHGGGGGLFGSHTRRPSLDEGSARLGAGGARLGAGNARLGADEVRDVSVDGDGDHLDLDLGLGLGLVHDGCRWSVR